MSDGENEQHRPSHLAQTATMVSNPFSTGGGGSRFEVQVQTAFAIFMLAGGFAPFLPNHQIQRIRLQARQAGYLIDDFVVETSARDGGNPHKLLVQVKHELIFTEANDTFRGVIKAAWCDYRNADAFVQKVDAIAIATGPLSATDITDTRRILDWARSSASAHEYFEKIGTTNFSSQSKRNKLAAFRRHIDAAAGRSLNDEDTFGFLRHLHVVGFDLDVHSGLMHTVLHGLIGRFSADNPTATWARVLEHVGSFNQDGGTLTVESFPEDIRVTFAPRPVETMPASLIEKLPPKAARDWNTTAFAEALAVANLVGGWSEGSEADMAVVAALTPDTPGEWLRKMREVLQLPDSPLSQAGGVWVVKHRVELWTAVAGRVFGETLQKFRANAVKVLREQNPLFDLEPEQRFAAQIYGKVLSHSTALRKGMAETLALLGTSLTRLPNVGPMAGDATATFVVRETLADADWLLWGSIDHLLPTLAEASPDAFLEAVEKALRQAPCPFDKLYAEERPALSGNNYMTGLLWALETMAWDEKHLVRVAVILAVMAARDPGGNWMNRPINSLKTIFLPWFPQTLASIEKRQVAVKAVVRERRDVGWRLLRSLMPRDHSTSSGTHRPNWRNKLNRDDVPRPTDEEYWKQVSSYVEMLVDLVKSDWNKLVELIEMLDSLPDTAINDILSFARSDNVATLTNEQRLPIWAAMSKLVRNHRRHATANWALPPELIDRIDGVAAGLAPTDPAVRHRVLFSSDSWDLYDEPNDWNASEERLDRQRRNAVLEIHAAGGIDAVVSFATNVKNALNVGFEIARADFPDVMFDWPRPFVLSSDPKQREMINGFAVGIAQRNDGKWLEHIDQSLWTRDELAQLSTYLPFNTDTLKLAQRWLGGDAKEYWERVPVHRFQRTDLDNVAMDALVRHGRPLAALACLNATLHDKKLIDPDRVLTMLLNGLTSKEETVRLDAHDFGMVIKALQDDPTTDVQKLRTVEWAYLTALENSHVTPPKQLNLSLSTDPGFFCEIIRLCFRSTKAGANEPRAEPTEEEKAFGQNAYRLLGNWKTVPGANESGDIDTKALTDWIDAVQQSLDDSGHLAVGLHKAGEVFIHAPADPDGLFIHHAAAAILNRDDMDELRRGYELGICNARGVHCVDPTGAPEEELARKHDRKADAAENAGFHRLAVVLRSVAAHYRYEAQRTIERYRDHR